MEFGSDVWYANRTNTEQQESPIYGSPVKIKTRPNYFTVMPVAGRGLLEVLKSGESVYDTWTIIANARIFANKIKVGDLMWVDGDNPTGQTQSSVFNYRQSATAIVDSVQIVRKTMQITIKRNQEKQ